MNQEELREVLRRDIEAVREYAGRTGGLYSWRNVIAHLELCLAVIGGDAEPRPKIELGFDLPPYDPNEPSTKFLADYLHHGGKSMGSELTKDMLADGLRQFAKQTASCGSCIFFRCEPIENVPRNGGHCKRFPPMPHSDFLFGQFPVVMPEDWCGEHQPAADVENES